MIHFLSAFHFSLIVLLLFLNGSTPLLEPRKTYRYYRLLHSFPVLPIFFCGIFLGIFDFGRLRNYLEGQLVIIEVIWGASS